MQSFLAKFYCASTQTAIFRLPNILTLLFRFSNPDILKQSNSLAIRRRFQFTLWPWPLTTWPWTSEVHRVSRSHQRLHQIWARWNNLQLSYCKFSKCLPWLRHTVTLTVDSLTLKVCSRPTSDLTRSMSVPNWSEMKAKAPFGNHSPSKWKLSQIFRRRQFC